MVFQSYALYPNMTVRAEHHLRPGDAQRAEGRARRGDRASVAKTAADRASARPQARASSPAASASAWRWAARWCASPSVFLFDEPLSNLDAKLRVEMRTEIKKLHQRLKAHHRLRHPRPDRGDDAGDAHRGDEGRRGPAARHAAGDLRQPGQPVRRRLHRLAVDEPDPGEAARRQRRASASKVDPRRGRPRADRCRWPTARRPARSAMPAGT